MTALAFEGVSKSYPVYDSPSGRLKELVTLRRRSYHRDFWALQDISFAIPKGSVFCLVGENGCGKSTTLQLAAGIFSPTSGTVRCQGRVSALLELGAGFNPEFSGRDNVYLSATLMGLSTAEIRGRFSEIERFAEIGPFIDKPVKTYSSGMLMRLAFAVAVHVDCEILLVDEALAVGDFYFRQRCLRKMSELRSRQTTIVFVSHNMADVQAIGSQAMWLEAGRCQQIGPCEDVVASYLARMAEKDARYIQARPADAADSGNGRTAGASPEIVRGFANIDRRKGDGGAEILGMTALNTDGKPVSLLEPNQPLIVRMSFLARRRIESPNAGVVIRNHVGQEFSGTDARREGCSPRPMEPGEICTVDFCLEVPELYPGNFSFSPFVTDGGEGHAEICDWVDNALTLQMTHGGQPIYGYIHIPCRVVVNGRLPAPESATRASPR